MTLAVTIKQARLDGLVQDLGILDLDECPEKT